MIYILVEKVCDLLMHDQISQISQLNRVVKVGILKSGPIVLATKIKTRQYLWTILLTLRLKPKQIEIEVLS